MAKPAIAVVGEADLILAGEMSGGEPAPLLQGGGAGDRYRLPTSGGNTLASAVDQPGWMAGDGSSLADERLDRRLSSTRRPTKASIQSAQAERDFLRLYPASTPIHALWCSVDTDGNGSLSESEVALLCKKMHVRWPTQKLWREAVQIAELNGKRLPSEWQDDAIDFPMFVHLYQALMGVERRTVRAEVKAAFERLDTGRSGTIGKAEIERLVRIRRKTLRLLPPGFEIETDWATMLEIARLEKEDGVSVLGSKLANVVTTAAAKPPPKANEISWEVFESWWKGRLGLLEADTAVLPEWFSYQLWQVKSRGSTGGAAPEEDVPEDCPSSKPKKTEEVRKKEKKAIIQGMLDAMSRRRKINSTENK